MFGVLQNIACFVTVCMSLLYGARIAWVCGRKCQFSESLENKLGSLVRSIPAATMIFFIGFLIVYSTFLDNPLTWLVAALTSSFVLATVIVSMAMPEFKRMPIETSNTLIQVKLKDGASFKMDKRALNASIEAGSVLKFRRASGWVDVKTAKLRGDSENTFFAGVDRREAT